MPLPIKFGYNTHESAIVNLVLLPSGSVRLTSLYSQERRKGHARQLMEHVINWADENGYSMILEVGHYGHPIGPDNDILIKFYESLGFELFVPETPKKRIIMTRSFA